MELRTKNVNTGLNDALWRMRVSGEAATSRNGDVLRYPEPVMITYTNPRERVLTLPRRDANPFFHFMECLWMLDGRRDVKWIAKFNKNMDRYSDDLETFHGAYGYRWRTHFRQDQILIVADMLADDPTTRRAVLTMWDPRSDLMAESKDLPCNTHIYFDIVRDRLNMTVCNRSNDMIWGMFGANAVHMSFLQEVMAAQIGVPVGQYVQFSNNMHIYLDEGQGRELLTNVATEVVDPYEVYLWEPYPIVADSLTWFGELDAFMEENFDHKWTNPFFPEVAIPMWKAWFNRREGISDGIKELSDCMAPDWRRAGEDWIMRRMK